MFGHSSTLTQGPLMGQSTTHTQGPVLGQSTTSPQEPPLNQGHTTGAPSLCVDRWSNWINKDTPSTGDGDREMLTPSELQQFCGNGKISTIECETTTGIASYSTGEIAMCTIEGGSVCLNADNAPMPCSDYKIRYFCKCSMYQLKIHVHTHFCYMWITYMWYLPHHLGDSRKCALKFVKNISIFSRKI